MEFGSLPGWAGRRFPGWSSDRSRIATRSLIDRSTNAQTHRRDLVAPVERRSTAPQSAATIDGMPRLLDTNSRTDELAHVLAQLIGEDA
jgi:hypothetical protein